MQVIAQERAHEHAVYVVRSGARQAVIVLRNGQCIKAEVVGCLSDDEQRSFAYEALTWLAGWVPEMRHHRSGTFEAVRLGVAVRRAS